MSASKALASRRIQDYRYFVVYQTNWNDNDQYSHLNNSVYNFLFDTVINKYLVEHAGIDPSPVREGKRGESPIGLVVESHAAFFRSLGFPNRLLLAMKVVKIGQSSVQYEVGIFGPLKAAASGFDMTSNLVIDPRDAEVWADSLDEQTVAVVGGFTHVFVDKEKRKSLKQLPESLRAALDRLVVQPSRQEARL